MLDLDSPRWSELTHAYGSAEDVPSLLRRILAGDGSAVAALIGSVCHQGSVYSASYATVPHLVAAARTAEDPALRAELLVLVGAICSSTDDRSSGPLPADLQRPYEAALPRALELAQATLSEPIESFIAAHLLEAAAALKGYLVLGRALSSLIDEELLTDCPNCARALYVWPDLVGLSTAAEDPVQVPTTKRTPVAPGPLPNSPLAYQYHWLVRVGGSAALGALGARLPYLFGSAVCPACGSAFSLIDELGARS